MISFRILRQSLSKDLRANSTLVGTWGGIAAYLTNPSFTVIARHRIASYVRRSKPGFLLAKWLWLQNVRQGVYISPTCQIEPGVRFPHPVGIVLGDGSIIREGATIYQGVTLGRKSSLAEEYPVVERYAIIYANSLLMGNIHIGEGAVVGALSVVSIDVPPHAVATGIPARCREPVSPA